MNWNMFIPIALGCVMANVAVRWIYFKILKVAFDKKLVDNPDARKLQKRPVPVVGGLAVFLGVLAGVLAATAFHYVFGAKSRMFIGDAGTMVMGVLMAWFVMCMLSKNSTINSFRESHNVNIIALSIAILSVPIFDTLRVMTMRIARGVSPFRPDKTHLHHVFVNVGLSHFITAISEILIGLTTTIICYISIRVGASLEVQLYVVALSSMWFVWGTYAILRYHVRRHTAFLLWLAHFSEKRHLSNTKWWESFTKWLDRPIDYAMSSSDSPAAKSAVAREKFKSHIQSIDINISK